MNGAAGLAAIAAVLPGLVAGGLVRELRGPTPPGGGRPLLRPVRV